MPEQPFYKSRLIVILKTLKNQRREILDFEQFVKNSFSDPEKDVVVFFLYIKELWKKITQAEPEDEILLNDFYDNQNKLLDKEKIFFHVYPDEPKFINWKFSQCSKKLSDLLEDFMVIKEAKKSNQREKLLLNAWKNRGIDKYYFDRTEKLGKQFSKKESREIALDAPFYQDCCWLSEHEYFHPNFIHLDRKRNDLLLVKMCESLDLGYAIKKLQSACEVYTRKRGSAFDFSLRFVEEIKQVVRKEYADKPVLMAYTDILDLFETKDVASIPRLKKQIFDLVEQAEINCKLGLLIKFFNALPNFDGRFALYFEIYQFALKNGILIEHGYIAHSHFINIVAIAVSLGEIDWLQGFFKQNSRYLKIDKKEKTSNIVGWYKAHLLYTQKSYHDAYRCLINLKIKDAYYGIRYHDLLIRTISDGKDKIEFKYDFDTKCNNFKTYLINNERSGKIANNVKKSWLKFIKICKKLYHWKFKPGNKQKLYQELEATYIPHKNWLKDKLDQLK